MGYRHYQGNYVFNKNCSNEINIHYAKSRGLSFNFWVTFGSQESTIPPKIELKPGDQIIVNVDIAVGQEPKKKVSKPKRMIQI
jgi:hypothetical protein